MQCSFPFHFLQSHVSVSRLQEIEALQWIRSPSNNPPALAAQTCRHSDCRAHETFHNRSAVLLLVVWNGQINSHRASNRSIISSSMDSHPDTSRHIIAVNSCGHIPGSSGIRWFRWFRYHSFINSIDLEAKVESLVLACLR